MPATKYSVDRSYTLPEAREYAARLAKSHYENFLVGSIFVPKELRQHFFNVYAYCRISDDLGDESGGPENALPLLNWWQEELESAYAGRPKHPVFVALMETNAKFSIPMEPYSDLLTAFRQDQMVTRYATHVELLNYCKYSANPVGRLVLYLCGYSDRQRQELSDATCTALQLVNFWQDVERDFRIGRIYIPQEDMVKFGVSEEQIDKRRFDSNFRELLKFECDRTNLLFQKGLELGPLVSKRVRNDIDMFSRGGLEIMRRIVAQDYDVLTSRPKIPKSRQIAILAGLLVSRLLPEGK
ncbi:MAG: squalene synthase HpnC [Chthonomonadales bacterium]